MHALLFFTWILRHHTAGFQTQRTLVKSPTSASFSLSQTPQGGAAGSAIPSETTAQRFSVAPILPGYKKSRILGLMKELGKDWMGVLKTYCDYCDESRLPGVVLPLGWVGEFDLVVDTASIAYILEDRSDNFWKSTIDKKSMGPLLGDGLLLSNGNKHTRMKRLVLPSLDPRSLTRFVFIMEQVALEITGKLDGNVNVTDVMTTFAMDVVGLSLFSQGHSLENDDKEETNVMELISACHDHVMFRDAHPLYPPLWLPTRKNRRFRRNRKQLNDYIYRLIETGRTRLSFAKREESFQQPTDLLGLLLTAQHEDTGDGLSNDELRDEVMTLFLAGHETSALALTYALWFLSEPGNAHWQDKIAQEYQQVQNKGGFSAAVLQDGEAMKYTRAVLCETLRLNGPVWAIDREVRETTVLPCGSRVQKGSILLIPNFAIHQKKTVFDDPHAFRPERFLTWTKDPWDGPFDRSEYFPFAAGRRRCIGVRFAQWEMLVALSTIIGQVSPSRLSGQDTLRCIPGITLRPEAGFQLWFTPRDPS